MTRKAKHIQALSEAEYVELIRELRLPRYADIPAIDLYMDQLLTYIDAQVRSLVAPDEKLLTASMVNNYVKVGMIPRPVGKKYDREHLAMLLMLPVFPLILAAYLPGRIARALRHPMLIATVLCQAVQRAVLVRFVNRAGAWPQVRQVRWEGVAPSI